MAQSPHITIVDGDGNPISTTTPLRVREPAANLTASATGANAAITATLPAAANTTTHILGFVVSGAGATAATTVTVTITGTISGTLNFVIGVPAGATTAATPLVVNFSHAIPASAANTAIVVNVPAFGTGNLNAAVTAIGYRA